MPLDPVVLDDLSWDDLMQFVRGRIPAASSGRWTLHAAVDPGITLLELYSSLFEQRLFWMDQPCDNRIRALIRLLGSEPKPAIRATTVLALSLAEATTPKTTVLPAGSILEVIGDLSAPSRMVRSETPPPQFTTRQTIALLPVQAAAIGRSRRSLPSGSSPVGLVVGGKDRSIDLRQGRAPRLLPTPQELAQGQPQEADILLQLSAAPPAVESLNMALLLDLVVPLDILPEWQPGSTPDVLPPANVTWWYHTGSGNFAAFDAPRIMDGTAGLRRPGLIQLPLPEAGKWVAGPGDTKSQYRLRLRVDGLWQGALPRVRQILPNAVIADHGTFVSIDSAKNNDLEVQINSWIGLPDSTLDLPSDAEGAVIPETVQVSIMEQDETIHKWIPVLDFSRSKSDDRHFVVDRDLGRLRFGDGYQGRVPRLLAKEPGVTVDFMMGGGSSGNFEQSQIWDASESGLDLADWVVRNVVPARGGTEPELLDMASARTGSERQSPSRAVTEADFEALATTTPGVAIRRAIAAVGRHPDFPCTLVPGAITVFIVPDEVIMSEDLIPGAILPVPDPGAIDAVLRRLSAARLVTQEIYVRGPIYHDISLVVTLTGHPADPDSVRSRIKTELATFLHPLQGGDDGGGWPFGGAISPSALMHRIQQDLEDDLTIVGMAIQPGNDGSAQDTCQDVTIGRYELVALRQVIVKFIDRPDTAEVLS